MKVAIIGMPKTGTTALYESIKNCLPVGTTTSFEPKNSNELQYVTNSQQPDALTKIMFGRLREVNFQVNEFDKVIVIVRDPRDYLVSSLLYKFDSPNLAKNRAKYNAVLNLFERKQNDPKSISFSALFNSFGEEHSWDKHLDLYYNLSAFIESNSIHLLRYEDFAVGNLTCLSNYLGLKVVNERELTGWTSKIKRKGVSGDWKNWFTSDDLYLKETFKPVMDKFGYSDWTLPEKPVIEKEYSLDYIRKLTEQNQVDPTKTQAVTKDYINNLYSAAKDNKVIPIVRLALLKLEGKYIDKDLLGALLLLIKASEMGSVRANRELGKLILETSPDNMKAIGLGAEYYFMKAVESNDPESCFFLGEMNLQGKDIDVNHDLAFKLFLKGAELGSKSCMRLLAHCYRNAIGVDRSESEANNWLDKRTKI
ncbi:hypothetical protein F9L16_06945 [Agarivorans sp. B2Z047]|uniref:sulfotransferase domain-containing protein n=1 Tax=Agarivorans sp. B2Z047 TaxID=2652721 RepID=UPI00128B412F|nr:sulfotransferase domain-containing protein [Agarivorans sp. B2Z047]MPW28740.1 hypothetical protein [Agarivorans sp. B2Z047]UQN41301.1 sulfotransferase domain-containing protein [Agarivorans sp. B2Z047]